MGEGRTFLTGPPGQALTIYVLNVFSLFDDGSPYEALHVPSPPLDNLCFVTKAGTQQCQDPRRWDSRALKPTLFLRPIAQSGQKVSEHHQEESGKTLSCLCDYLITAVLANLHVMSLVSGCQG